MSRQRLTIYLLAFSLVVAMSLYAVFGRVCEENVAYLNLAAHAGAAPVTNSNVSSEDEQELDRARSSDADLSDTDVDQSGADSALAKINHFGADALYSKYLQKAEEGDPDAVYVLVTVLRECRNTASTEEQLTTATSAARLTKDQTLLVQARFRACWPLRERLADLHAEHDRWYRITSEAKHPLLSVHQRNLSYEELRVRVLTAVSKNYPEPHLYADVYGAAARLHVDFPGPAQNETKYRAWDLLACEVSITCNHAELLVQMRAHMPGWQLKESLATADALREALVQRDTNALGL